MNLLTLNVSVDIIDLSTYIYIHILYAYKLFVSFIFQRFLFYIFAYGLKQQF